MIITIHLSLFGKIMLNEKLGQALSTMEQIIDPRKQIVPGSDFFLICLIANIMGIISLKTIKKQSVAKVRWICISFRE